MARHRSPQGRNAGLGHLSPQFAVAGVPGTASTFPAGPHVRRARPAGWSGASRTPSRFSAPTKVVAAVAAVGGLAGAAYATSGSADLPSPAAWFDTAAGEAPAAAVPAPRAPVDDAAATPIADARTIAALATPAAAGGSVAARTVTSAAPAVRTGAAEAAKGASASVTEVQKAAAERAKAAAEQAKAAEAARAAGSSGSSPSSGGASSAAAGGAVSIVSGQVTSGFGSRWGSQHMGLDIAAPIGTPIHVPLGGTVISSGPASGFGLWVRVQHDDGTVTVYGHINRSLVEVGQKVTAGQQIAEVGNRGQSTGPHVHIEVVDPGGSKINPRPWLDANGFSYA